MSSLFAASYAALWCLVLVSLTLMLLLYRQYGLTIMPGRQRINLRGLDIGASPPTVPVADSAGQPFELSWSVSDTGAPGAQVAVFAEPTCPICAGLLDRGEELTELASKWSSIEFIWVDGPAFNHDHDPIGWTIAVNDQGTAIREMQIPAFPFAYVVADGRVAAKGLINHAQDIEELVQSALGSHPKDKTNGEELLLRSAPGSVS